MLPKKISAGKTRRLFIAFLVLSPLAYFIGSWLTLKHDPMARAGVSLNRQESVAIATDFATAKGVNTAGWSNLCHFKLNNELYFYQRLEQNAAREQARAIVPATILGVLLRSPDRKENFEVEMTVNGQVLGYEHRTSSETEESDPGEPAARQVAQQALQKRLSSWGISDAVEVHQIEATGDKRVDPQGRLGRPKGAVRKYTARLPFPTLPELEVNCTLTVRGNRIIGDRVDATVNSDFAQKQLNHRPWLKGTSIAIYALAVTIIVIFGIYRFIQRARQKEVSFLRVLILILLFVSVMVAFQASTDTPVYDIATVPNFPAPDWVILIQVAVSNLVLGLLLGLAYGSGEGDIREAYPGKLTSLDALLMGKLFSRNVARSTVWGWAIGGWIMLTFQLGALPWNRLPGAGEPPGQFIDAWLGKLPPVSPFMVWPIDVILVAVIGLLVPLPFLLRRQRFKRARMPLLFIFSWIACAAPYLDFRPFDSTLLVAIGRAALFLLAFFSFDLLTAVIALAAPTFISFALSLAAQPDMTLRYSGIFSIAMALVILAAELIFAVKGRIYREEEVRPVYAGILADRLSMQAEVSAAKEAQQRLMPDTLPQSEFFSIAACCLPAFEVGGDFFEIFKLEGGKIGLLVAEGGGRGLGSALSIAYAKGFLMPKILSNTQSDNSPTEILRGLQDRLNSLLDKDTSVGLAYAVLDPSDGRLRYARTGSHPIVVIHRKNAPAAFSAPEEREVIFSSTREGEKSSVAKVIVTEGTLGLEADDSVILFTDGLDKDWKQEKTKVKEQFARMLNAPANASGGELQKALNASINECFKRARKQGVEDDLTAVIVRFEKTALEDEHASAQGEAE